MDLGSILVIIAIVLLVALFVGQPLMDTRKEKELVPTLKTASEKDHLRSSLLAERDRLLTALQELDFDNALGKIPEQDFPVQRAILMQKGSDVLRQLDELEPARSNAQISAEDRLEAAIEARRADSAGASQSLDDVELAIAARRRVRLDKSAGFCPKCGNPLQTSDSFCSKCGQPVVGYTQEA